MTPRAKGRMRFSLNIGGILAVLLSMGQLYRMSLDNQQAAEEAASKAAAAESRAAAAELRAGGWRTRVVLLEVKVARLEARTKKAPARGDQYPPGVLVGPQEPSEKGTLGASAAKLAGQLLGTPFRVVSGLFGLGKHQGG